MATLEQVEKLREKANVSYEDAKAALDAAGGEILDALIWLEKQGKTAAPNGGGTYSSKYAEEEKHEAGDSQARRARSDESFGDMAARFGRFCAKVFNIGNTNHLVAVKNGEEVFACPITVVVLLVAFFFWVVVPLFILSLFFGFRYSIRGSELGTESVNKVMDGASDTVEGIKKNFNGEKH